MTPLRWFLLLMLTAGVALFSWGHAQARADPIVRHARFGFRDWPRGKAPVRVVLASDLHLGNETMDPARLARIARQIDALSPDVVLLAGDFVAGYDKPHARKAAADMVAPLSTLRAPLGVIAVLGNHDQSTDPKAIGAALGRAGISVLHDRAVQAGPLIVVGFNDLSSGSPHVGQAIATARGLHGIPIALAHADYRTDLQGRIQLMLVGHTHCEQIDLKPFGIRQQYVKVRYPCGIVRDRSGVTLTTAGLGTSVLPLRYNVPPDLWVLTLGPAAAR